ncbi:hypothetical protein BJ165DRAFT_318325 [Panaeolus papilionaceus]|nr:hypothetical protein BJ165DRAFT_318325 [Panaeolus papilionaceus]
MSRTLSGGVGVGVPASTSSSSNAPSTSTNTPVPTHPTPHPTQSSTPNLLSNPSSTSHLSNPSGTFLSPSQLAMGSFKNKNKKKGFKASMSNVIPRKVVWGSDGEEVALEALEIQGQEVQQGIQGSDEAQAQIVYVPSTPAAPPYQTPTPRSSTFASSSYSGFAATNPYPRARLVPPSEIQERGALPERMFVSCRVEYEGWQDQDVDQGAGYGEGMQWEDEKEVVLNYGDEDEDAVMAGPGVEESTKTTKTPEFDWDHADEIYEKAKVVSGESQVVVGGLVGWKTLAINPQTFTPENMLTVARIVEISTPPPASSSSEPPQGSAPAPTPSTQKIRMMRWMDSR